jgi:predicted NUDIX family NTP pyrophosphohydrolase
MTDSRTGRQPPKISAGLLMYRVRAAQLEVLLVHLGGPYWSRKDAGAWFIPKGGIEAGENEFSAAQREFYEETGLAPQPPFLALGSVQHKSGKRVMAWAFAGDANPATLRSNTFQLEWPPKSGKFREFPEIDRGDFFTVSAAAKKMHPAELVFVTRLEEMLKTNGTIQPTG